MAPNVDGTHALARRILHESWVAEPDDKQLKLAVTLELHADVTFPLVGNKTVSLTAVGNAATCGASNSNSQTRRRNRFAHIWC
jgi:hypothetical protein